MNNSHLSQAQVYHVDRALFDIASAPGLFPGLEDVQRSKGLPLCHSRVFGIEKFIPSPLIISPGSDVCSVPWDSQAGPSPHFHGIQVLTGHGTGVHGVRVAICDTGFIKPYIIYAYSLQAFQVRDSICPTVSFWLSPCLHLFLRSHPTSFDK